MNIRSRYDRMNPGKTGEIIMSKYDKKYDAFQLFEQILEQEEADSSYLPEENSYSEQLENSADDPNLSDDDIYYEIEYDSVSMPGVGKFVKKSKKAESTAKEAQREVAYQAEPLVLESQKELTYQAESFVLESQKTELPARDEVREQFNRMRDIARSFRTYHSTVYNNSRFYNPRVQQENSIIFYNQGLFMKNFEDTYTKQVPYSSYFPYYQMMGYDQLRTYFTWRTQVRRGIVTQISLSYAYLYIYELLNNIGVQDPQDGLDKLMFFWKKYQVFDSSIDKYIIKWLKDYHIYYEPALSFSEFTEQNNLTTYYQELSDPEDRFSMLCATSKYDIRKSVFFTEDRTQLIEDCVIQTLERVRQCFTEHHLDFDEFLYQPAKNMTPWVPFKGALFYPWLSQRDRRVVFSEKEIYTCHQNKWYHQTSLTNESGRKLLGYIIKQTEVALRQAVKFKYKLTANIQSVDFVIITRLSAYEINLEHVINQAVIEFYREATKTVVKVDAAALERIRQEALITQEKLTVPEDEAAVLPQTPEFSVSVRQFAPKDGQPAPSGEYFTSLDEASVLSENQTSHSSDLLENFEEHSQEQFLKNTREDSQTESPEDSWMHPQAEFPEDSLDDSWTTLRDALSETERTALAYLLNEGRDIKGFADEHGVMLEVLMDGINEKAMDTIGDSLVDEEFTIYEDYIEDIKGMVE